MIVKVISLEKDYYRKLEEWGAKNDIKVSDKISLNFISINEKYYVAKENIKKGDILLSVPYNSIINFEKIKKLSSKKQKKKLDKLREKFKELYFIKGYDKSEEVIDVRIDQIIFAVAEYFCVVEEKGKLLQNFEPYFMMYETNTNNYPLFYSFEQQYLLQNTSLGSLAIYQKQSFDQELKLINEVYKMNFVDEEYYKSRLLTSSKSYKILDSIGLVPFSDLFQIDPNTPNADYAYDNESQILNINATENIQKGDIVKIKIPPMSNADFLIFYGKTYQTSNEPIKMLLPMVHPDFLKKNKFKYEDFNNDIDIRIDLMNDEFYKQCEEPYKQILKKLNLKESQMNFYTLLKENINYYLEGYNYIKESDIIKVFNEKDRKNVKLVIGVEKKILKERMAQLDEFISEIKKKSKAEL